MASAIVRVTPSNRQDGTCPALMLAIAFRIAFVDPFHAWARSFESNVRKHRKDKRHKIPGDKHVQFRQSRGVGGLRLDFQTFLLLNRL